ncbi:MAG: hypothetical protein RMK80_06425 [Pseudobdellovibrionaceae bacterium]|nr:hypothetical protein [Pseudobdellovibrionaceae bacterium]
MTRFGYVFFVLIFIFPAVMGFLLVGGDWQVFRDFQKKRVPATFPTMSFPQSPEEQEALLQKISQSLQIIDYQEGFSEILFPSILFSDPTFNDSFSLCEEFPRITFLFEGEGVYVHGESVELEIDWTCQYDESGNTLPLRIPSSYLVSQKPFSGDFVVDENTTLRFFKTDEAWPQAWVLTGVILQDAKGSSPLSLEKGQLIQWRKVPIGLRWQHYKTSAKPVPVSNETHY